MKIALTLLLLFPLASSAQAYKCVVEGRNVMTDKPCKNGVEIELKTPKGFTESDGGMTKDKAKKINNAVSRRLINDDIDRLQAQMNALRTNYERINVDMKNRMPVGNSERAVSQRNAITNELTSIGQEYDRKMRDLEAENTRLKTQRDAIKDN